MRPRPKLDVETIYGGIAQGSVQAGGSEIRIMIPTRVGLSDVPPAVRDHSRVEPLWEVSLTPVAAGLDVPFPDAVRQVFRRVPVACSRPGRRDPERAIHPPGHRERVPASPVRPGSHVPRRRRIPGRAGGRDGRRRVRRLRQRAAARRRPGRRGTGRLAALAAPARPGAPGRDQPVRTGHPGGGDPGGLGAAGPGRGGPSRAERRRSGPRTQGRRVPARATPA